MKTEPWNIKQLHEKLQEDLLMCNTAFERSMVQTIGGKEIRDKAKEYQVTRKLTPGEAAILEKYYLKGV